MIYELLLNAKGYKLTRQELERLTGFSDRRNRKIIAEERKEHVILSSSHHTGYYLPTSREQILDFIEEEKSRIANIERSLKAAKKELKRIDTRVQPDLIGAVMYDGD